MAVEATAVKQNRNQNDRRKVQPVPVRAVRQEGFTSLVEQFGENVQEILAREFWRFPAKLTQKGFFCRNPVRGVPTGFPMQSASTESPCVAWSIVIKKQVPAFFPFWFLSV